MSDFGNSKQGAQDTLLDETSKDLCKKPIKIDVKQIKTRKAKNRKRKKKATASFLKEWSRSNGLLVLGFALCQTWLTLCFFVPQLYPGNRAITVYEVSLVVTFVTLIPGVLIPKKLEALNNKQQYLIAIAVAASLGTLLVPFANAEGVLGAAILIIAALLSGVASGWLFIAWYRVFAITNDYVGYVLSVALNAVLLYVFTTILLPPAFNPLILMALAVVMPLISVALLCMNTETNAVLEFETTVMKCSQQRLDLVGLCAILFVVSSLCDFMRNQYLGGTDLEFYSGAVNLVLLFIKIACSIFVVVVLGESNHAISLLFQVSLLLLLVSALFMPYVNANWGYAITNIGAFFFKITIMLVALLLYQRYRISPILIFSLTRIAWSADLFFTHFVFNAYAYLAHFVPNLLGISASVMSLLLVIVLLFAVIRPSKRSIDEETTNVGDIQLKCDRLARIGKLTKRESEILVLIAHGRSTPRIQEELMLSANTVNSHTRNVYRKLGIHSRQELLDMVERTAPEDAETEGN